MKRHAFGLICKKEVIPGGRIVTAQPPQDDAVSIARLQRRKTVAS